MCGMMGRFKHLLEEEILIHLLLSYFVSRLSRDQRIEFGFILKLLKKKYAKNLHQISSNNQRVLLLSTKVR